MNEEKTNKRKRIILITACVIAFIIIILFIFRLLTQKANGGKVEVEDQKRLSGMQLISESLGDLTYSIGSQACTSDNKICVRDVTFHYFEDEKKGYITYAIDNNGPNTVSGMVRVKLGTYKLVFKYENLTSRSSGGSGTINGIYGYDNFDFDFSSLTSFTVEYSGTGDSQTMYESMSNTDKEAIVVH